VRFNNRYSKLCEVLDDTGDWEPEPLGVAKIQKKHPIQLLLDYGYSILPGKYGVIVDPSGKAYELPPLYDAILDYLKKKRDKEI
jgi:hypothetical protein